jgi:hypothetical protein
MAGRASTRARVVPAIFAVAGEARMAGTAPGHDESSRQSASWRIGIIRYRADATSDDGAVNAVLDCMDHPTRRFRATLMGLRFAVALAAGFRAAAILPRLGFAAGLEPTTCKGTFRGAALTERGRRTI